VCSSCAQKEYDPARHSLDADSWWRHESWHHLVRITDSTLYQEPMDHEKRLALLDAKIQDMAREQELRLAAIESSMNERFAKLEGMLERLLMNNEGSHPKSRFLRTGSS
jgi:hypothetical protein